MEKRARFRPELIRIMGIIYLSVDVFFIIRFCIERKVDFSVEKTTFSSELINKVLTI